jgi:hypothetical protein
MKLRANSTQSQQPMSCAWCDERTATSEDHLFPRSIGGTRELWVPACTLCQTRLSKVEKEASRQSHYALFCMLHGPSGRDKRKAGSGVIRTRYLLCKHPLGGYCESLIRAGAPLPEALPYIEIEVASGCVRRRGPTPESVDKLVSELLQLIDRKPDNSGLIGELDVRTDNLLEVGEDFDFWPRIVRDPSGHIFIRARNGEEALLFIAALVPLLKVGAIRDYSGWLNSEISGGTPHSMSLSYNKSVVHRLAGKIACALMFLEFGPAITANPEFRSVRQFVLEGSDDGSTNPTTTLSAAGTEVPWGSNHIAVISKLRGHTAVIVSVYGDCQLVEFGTHVTSIARDVTNAAVCRWDGTRAQIISHASMPTAISELRRLASEFYTQPLKYPVPLIVGTQLTATLPTRDAE